MGKRKKIDPKELYVVTTIIAFQFDDESNVEAIPCYFLAYEKDDEYYEFFSGVRLKYEEEDFFNGEEHGLLDTPYVKKVECLIDCMETDEVELTNETLFAFIIEANLMLRLES